MKVIKILFLESTIITDDSCHPYSVRSRSSAARLPRSRLRIPKRAWMLVCCVLCCDLCDELIIRLEEFYRLCMHNCV